MLTSSDLADIPLTDSEKENVLILIDIVLRYPNDVKKIIRAAGLTPSTDEQELVYQLIEARAIDANSFDSSMMDFQDENLEFVGGLAALVGKAGGAVVGLFKKKRKADGTKGLIGRVFDKIKAGREKRKERRAKRKELEVEEDDWEDEDENGDEKKSRDRRREKRDRGDKKMTKKETEEALDKAKKMNVALGIVSGALLISVVVMAIFLFKK